MALKFSEVSKVTEKYLPWVTRLEVEYLRFKRKRSGAALAAFLVSRDGFNEIDKEWNRHTRELVQPFRLLSYCNIPIYESFLANGREILLVTNPAP